MIKKILKWILIVFLLLLIGLFIFVKVKSEPQPKVMSTAEADALAQSMLESMNKPAWDSIKYMKWEFMTGFKYLWDKQNNNALVSWGSNEVLLNLDEVSGIVKVDGKVIEGDKKEKIKPVSYTHLTLPTTPYV